MDTRDGHLRLQIEQVGAGVLHRSARAVEAVELESPEVRRLIDLMFATLAGTGVGLAAPQVGIGVQIVVIADPAQIQTPQDQALFQLQERVPVPPHVLVNPVVEVLDDGDVAEFFEGCLSVDGYRAIVPRARRVRVRGLDHHGESFEREASGWYARIIQHEVDHLAGRLYVERMLPRTFVTASAAMHWAALPIDEAKRQLNGS
jgi:peptide deformylase